ncbi:MAG: hypothetical protein IPM64_16775 [Phycisphaerales bacterium]|nr:hypothetical protein [Phycisphaerales bacterium]
MRTLILASMLSVAVALAGCERKPESTKPAAGGSSGAAKQDDHDHKPGEKDDHDHGKEADTDGAHGPSIELGEATVNGMKVKAARDAGDIKPGGDAAIDVWVDGGLGNAAAVRFWIGTEDAKGSIKSKAEVEDGKWHTHAEVPDPLPAGSKVWVEIEGKDGKKSVASFELKK